MGRGDVHLEVEAKFDLEDDSCAVDVESLRSVKGVREVDDAGTTRLTATYYDTPELNLLRHGITLRRRTGGTDAGWHLKLPSGATGPDGEGGAGAGRLEVHRPAGRSGSPLPAELLALVRARLRDRLPEPVVTLRTSRTLVRLSDGDGTVLADVTDDRVSARVTGRADRATPAAAASSWREVEVELVAAGPALLAAVAKRLRRQGATAAVYPSKLARALDGHLPPEPVPNGHRGPRRGAGAGDLVLSHLRAQRDELLSCDPLARLDQADAVHRMRVATRRLRSALATFRPLFTADSTVALRAELAWLAGVLGTTRDAEVLRDLLSAELDRVPADLLHGPIAERIRAGLVQTYGTAHTELVAELDGTRYLKLLADLDSFVDDPPFAAAARRPADPQIPALVARAVSRAPRALAAALAEPDLDQRELRSHEVRKAAKRARYAAEAVSGLFGAPARAQARRMRQVQETLGSHQDSLLAREWLLAAALRAHALGEPTFGYGVLHARQAYGDGDTDANLATAARLLEPPLGWPGRGPRR